MDTVAGHLRKVDPPLLQKNVTRMLEVSPLKSGSTIRIRVHGPGRPEVITPSFQPNEPKHAMPDSSVWP